MHDEEPTGSPVDATQYDRAAGEADDTARIQRAAEAAQQPGQAAVASEPAAGDTNGNGAAPKADFDLNLDEFNTLTVQLGGRPFLAKEPSIKTQKDVIRQARDEGLVDDDTSDEEALEAIKSLKSLDGVYQQIREVLFHLDGDEQGKPPSAEFAEEHLRLSSFGRLFKKLAQVDDADAEGKP